MKQQNEVPLKYRRRTRRPLRPVLPKFNWMICPNMLAYVMSWYGLLIGKFPAQMMSMTLGVGLILAAGVMRINIGDLSNDDFIPTSSPSLIEQQQVANFSNENFNGTLREAQQASYRRVKRDGVITTPKPILPGDHNEVQPCRNLVMVVAKNDPTDPNGRRYNLKNRNMLLEVQKLENQIYNIDVDLRAYSGKIYSFEASDQTARICVKYSQSEDCNSLNLRYLSRQVTALTNNSGDSSLTQAFLAITWPYYDGANGRSDLSKAFGDVETADSKINSAVRRIGAMQMLFCTGANYSGDNNLFYARDVWERKFDDLLRNFKSPYFDVYWQAQYQIEEQQVLLAVNMLPKLFCTFVALMIWCSVGSLTRDAVRSKPWPGFIGICSTFFACCAGFGACLWTDPSFRTILLAIPLMTLAIGLDDMFIMLEAWSDTDHRLPVEERMMLAMNTGGTSIVITFFVNLLDFVIGSYTPYPIIQMLSEYSIATMVADFVFQMTVFAPSLVLFGRQEAQNKHSCCCCCVTSPAKEELDLKAKNGCFVVCCAGGFPREEKTKKPVEEKEHFVVKTIVNGITALPCRILIIFLFAGYLGASVWALGGIDVGLKPEHIYRQSSNLYDYAYQFQHIFMSYGSEISVVIMNEIDYSSPKVQRQLLDLVDNIEGSGYFWGDSMTRFWLRDFRKWASLNRVNLTALTSNADILNEFQGRFLFNSDPDNGNGYWGYQGDLRVDIDATTIKRSRFKVRSKDMTSPERQIAMMKKIRSCLDFLRPDYEIYAFSDFGEFLISDIHLSAIPATLYYCSLTLGVTVGVAFFMIPQFVCLFWVAFFVLSILIGIIGLLSLWGIDLDSISLMSLLVAISFCSDLIAHPIYIFMISPPDDEKGVEKTGSEARVIKAQAVVREVIAAAVPACVGTTLSVIAMSTSDAYILVTFFRSMFLSVVLSVAHALIFIPAFLSFIGPSNTRLQKVVRNDDEKQQIQADVLSKKSETRSKTASIYRYENGSSPSVKPVLHDRVYENAVEIRRRNFRLRGGLGAMSEFVSRKRASVAYAEVSRPPVVPKQNSLSISKSTKSTIASSGTGFVSSINNKNNFVYKKGRTLHDFV